jgi:hypothetical protein
MAPRKHNRRIDSSQEPEPSLPTDTQLNDTDIFHLDNISGSDDDDIQVNVPGVQKPSRNTAKDIEYFFKKVGNKAICLHCRYACFLRDELFGF